MPTILAIDDMPDNLVSIAALLKMTMPDLTVYTAQSGQKGIAQAQAACPDVILLDIVMPKMDGYEVCQRLRADSDTKHIPIIMLTALRTDAQSRIKGLQAGADAFLAKPVDEGELCAQINVMLRIRKAENLLLQERDALDAQVRSRTVELEKTNRRLHAELAQRKQAEGKLRKSEAKFRSLFEQAGDYILLLEVTEDKDLVIADANQAACEIHGYTRAEFLGMSIKNLDRCLDEKQVRALLNRVMAGESILFETAHAKKDGTIFPIEVSGKLLDSEEERTLIISIERDITERKRVEAKLKASEKRSRAWLAYSPVCTKIVDLDFNLKYMSAAGVEQLKIDDITQLYGTPYPFAFYPDSFSKPMTENLERARDTGEIVTQEAFVLDMEGNELWFHSTLVPVNDDDGRVDYIIIVSIDVTERKRAEVAVLNNQDQLKSLASELVLAEERERQRIALCLHDDVCQNLAYSKMKLQILRAALDDQSRIEDTTEICDTLTHMMQEVRSLTFELSSPLLVEFGLEAAVSNWLKEQIEEKHGIETVFRDDGQTKPLSADVQAMLFRSVRELLANAVKYSESRSVDVCIARDEDEVVVTIEDNGVGFTPETIVISSESGGFGLFSIRERLDQLGGGLEIHSRPGQGCKCILRAPLQQV